MVVIHTSVGRGACSLIVWAHQVLGLTVVVKQDGQRNELLEETFGDGPSQVVIDLRDRIQTWDNSRSTLEMKMPSIVYMSISDQESKVLVTLRPEPDEGEIDAVFTQPARGYSTKVLESVCRDLDGKDALVRELTMLCVAFAAIISQQLYPKPRSAFADDGSLRRRADTNKSSEDNFREDSKCTVSPSDVIEAAQFLFCDARINKTSVSSHILMLQDKPLDMQLAVPQSISLILDQMRREMSQEPIWHDMLEKIRYISVVVVAFTFVRDRSDCDQLPLTHSVNVLGRNDLILRLNQWNGTSPIWIPEETWFLVLAELLIGHKATIDSKTTCLISQRGWSIFLSTFGEADPSYVDAGYVVIKKGVPCRNGV